MKTHLIPVCLGALILATQPARAVFTDWIAFSDASNTATGMLGSVTVSLSTQDGTGGGVLAGSVINGTFAGFSTPTTFTPSIALTDGLLIAGASDFTLDFSANVTTPILHIYQLANNTLTFTNGLTISIANSDNDFIVSSAAVTGIGTGDAANGSVIINGTINRVRWVSNGANAFDSVFITVSDVPEPAAAAVLALGAALCVRRVLRSRRA